MSDPRLTEERLRYFLDTNQLDRERMCLAVLPLIGPYTQERHRRPKGGPDGGRDIEAVYQGATIVWGAVGFQNGGGNDETARREAKDKFNSDLKRALEENAGLQGFVFFTNVDLTPTIIDELKSIAGRKGVAVVDVCDMERLRHVLDSPEGLIARLQYLKIPMSETEQMGLINKFGNELQKAVVSRFDRVERTLAEMDRFLEYQKPLYRYDVYVELTSDTNSAAIGDEAVLLQVHGIQEIDKHTWFLCVNHTSHQAACNNLITRPFAWLGEHPDKFLSFMPSVKRFNAALTAYFEMSITAGGARVRIGDLNVVRLAVYATAGLKPFIKRVVIDLNGFEFFNCRSIETDEIQPIELPTEIPFDGKSKTWMTVVKATPRNVLFDPPRPSGRHGALIWESMIHS